MSILKKIFNSLLSDSRQAITPSHMPKNNYHPQLSRHNYDKPNYSAYVYIRPTDGIYVVNSTDRINAQFRDITQAYANAKNTYANENSRKSSEKDFKVPFKHLSTMFNLILLWFCKKSSLNAQGKDVFETALLLKGTVFNPDQMNVINGVLALIDKYESGIHSVSDYDIKTYFISMGIIFKLFKERASGKNINKIPCTFEAMRQKEAAKEAKKAKNKEIASNPNAQALKSIDNEYSKAKNFIKQNKPYEAIKTLQAVATTCTRRICKLNDIDIKQDGKVKETVLLLEELASAKAVRSSYIDAVKSVIDVWHTHPDGKGITKDEFSALAQSISSIVITTTKNQTEKNSYKQDILPDIKAPSFKKIEGSGTELNLEKEHPQLFTYIKDAEALFNEAETVFNDTDALSNVNKLKLSLNLVRQALEYIVGHLCEKFNLPSENNIDLIDKINSILKNGNLSDSQSSDMQKARKLGNLGSHWKKNEKEPTARDVAEALSLIKPLSKVFIEIMADGKGGKNVPMRDPDYYNRSRRYYGKWHKAFTRQDLMLDMDYVKLERKATEGDVGAMLDIASGFLNDKINWQNNTNLIKTLPSNNYTLSPDEYDARYYFWILKACEAAYSHWVKGEEFSLKYIATALVEAIKFIHWHNWYLQKQDACSNSATQYMLTNQMFGSEFPVKENFITDFANMIICMFEEYAQDGNNGYILSPIHSDINADKIRRHVYFHFKTITPDATIKLNSRLLLKQDHAGKKYKDILNA